MAHFHSCPNPKGAYGTVEMFERSQRAQRAHALVRDLLVPAEGSR